MPQWLQTWDESVLWWIAEHVRVGFLDPVVKFYSSLGNTGMLFIVLALVLMAFASTRRAGFSAGAGMLLGLLVTNVTVKPLVARARPWVVMEGFVNLLSEKDYSFPSGHSCAAFAFAVGAFFALPRRWMKVTALTLAVLMALSRLYVGVHFPSDVIAGSIIGALCGLAGGWIVSRIIGVWKARRARKGS